MDAMKKARLERSLAELPETQAAYDDHVRRRVAIYGSEYQAIMAFDAFNQVLWPHLERLLMARRTTSGEHSTLLSGLRQRPISPEL